MEFLAIGTTTARPRKINVLVEELFLVRMVFWVVLSAATEIGATIRLILIGITAHIVWEATWCPNNGQEE